MVVVRTLRPWDRACHVVRAPVVATLGLAVRRRRLERRNLTSSATAAAPPTTRYEFSADPLLRGRVARLTTPVLVGTHHGLPRASSAAVERVLEAERPDAIVAESVYSRYKLPPYETRACEFAFTTQWALKHNVRIVQGNPVHRSLEGRHRPYHEVRWGRPSDEEKAGTCVRPYPDAPVSVRSLLLRASIPLYEAAVPPLLRVADMMSRGSHRFLSWDDRMYFTRYYPLAYRIYMSSVERELFFIKSLREVPGTKIVGVFGLLHLAGILSMWDEYAVAPYTLWQTTEHEGKDITRALATAHTPAITAYWQAHAQSMQRTTQLRTTRHLGT